MLSIPLFLQPDFTWPRPMQPSLSTKTPKMPSMPGKLRRRMMGLVHKALSYVSDWYCAWFGITTDYSIYALPFGLVMKWTDRTSLEEVAAMQMARAAGMPVPKVISCGEHPNSRDNCFISILMTRLPGIELNNSGDPLHIESEKPWIFELKKCVEAMRKWQSPYSGSVCSVLGTSIRSSRVPNHIMGPFRNTDEFHDFLLSPAGGHGFNSTEEYLKTYAEANEIRKCCHKILFTHGDLKAHNILVGNDGHLSGFLDWESAGWCPEYWEFTTAIRYGRKSWWGQVASWMGGDRYSQELAYDIALNALTVDSYAGW